MPALRARAHNRAHDRCLLKAEHDHEHEHENENENEAPLFMRWLMGDG
jgi:hypothetical protein